MLPLDERDELIAIADDKICRNTAEGKRRGFELIEKSGAFKACETKAHDLLEPHWREISNIIPPSEAKIMLRFLMTRLLGMRLEI
nr:hypothetical protein [uncultured Cohaesibacter sp.]